MGYNIFTFPLEQIGWALRQLSLSGTVGNIVAILLYLFTGSIPCGIFLVLKRKGINCKMDYLLLVLSVLLLVVLYYMINPGLLAVTMLGNGKLLLSGTFYSAVVSYLVLRMMDLNSKNKATDLVTLQKTIRIVLYMVMILLVCCVLVECFVNLPANLNRVKEANNVSGEFGEFFYGAPDLTMTNIFLILQSIINALPYALDTIIVFWCIKTLKELLLDSYSEKSVLMIHKVTQLCRKSLVIVLISGVMFNFAQMLFSNQLYQMNIVVNIPLFSILFMLVIHLLAKYIEENQRLKEDNELFI